MKTEPTQLTQFIITPSVIAQTSLTFWGSYIATVSHAIVKVFWFANQTMNGTDTDRVILSTIWSAFSMLPDHISRRTYS